MNPLEKRKLPCRARFRNPRVARVESGFSGYLRKSSIEKSESCTRIETDTTSACFFGPPLAAIGHFACLSGLV